MEITQLKALQIAKMVDRILHIPGNYKGGILEMTIVLDCSLEKEDFQESLKNIIQALKRSNDVFRNVRLNVIYWSDDQIIDSTIIPMSFLQTESCFENYKSVQKKKCYQFLFAYLKKFQARSKIVLVLDGGKNVLGDQAQVKIELAPFLKGKLLKIGDEIQTGTQIFLS